MKEASTQGYWFSVLKDCMVFIVNQCFCLGHKHHVSPPYLDSVLFSSVTTRSVLGFNMLHSYKYLHLRYQRVPLLISWVHKLNCIHKLNLGVCGYKYFTMHVIHLKILYMRIKSIGKQLVDRSAFVLVAGSSWGTLLPTTLNNWSVWTKWYSLWATTTNSTRMFWR